MVKILSIQKNNLNIGTFSSIERGGGGDWTLFIPFQFSSHHVDTNI